LPRLIIRSSDIHAAGCFALDDIPNGTRILEYTGERITKAEGDDRYDGRPFTYLFGVGDGEVVIDGHGMAMFVNHSCDPNCETDEDGDRVFIASIRDIAAGEELTYDYWLYDGEDDAPVTAAARAAGEACTRLRSSRRKPEPRLARTSGQSSPPRVMERLQPPMQRETAQPRSVSPSKMRPARPTPRSYNQNFLP
jgi:hypothetical protein